MSHRNRVRRAQRRAGTEHCGKPVTRSTRLAMGQALDDLETLAGEALDRLERDDFPPQTREAVSDALGPGLDDLLADVQALVRGSRDS